MLKCLEFVTFFLCEKVQKSSFCFTQTLKFGLFVSGISFLLVSDITTALIKSLFGHSGIFVTGILDRYYKNLKKMENLNKIGDIIGDLQFF